MNMKIPEYHGFRDRVSSIVGAPEIGTSISDTYDDDVLQKIWMLQVLGTETGLTTEIRDNFANTIIDLLDTDTSVNKRRSVLAFTAIGIILDELPGKQLDPMIERVLADAPIFDN